MENEEIWKTYPEFPWVEGSNLGRVRTIGRYVNGRWGKMWIEGRILKPQVASGYLRVHFKVSGKQVTRLVHRIIAACFIPNPDNLPQVNHIDCCATNNAVSNLEWCTHQENIAYRNELGHQANCGPERTPVIAINLKTSEVLQFPSRMEASRQLGADHSAISAVIKGKRKTHYGYWFINTDNHAVEATRTKFADEVANRVTELMEGE